MVQQKGPARPQSHRLVAMKAANHGRKASCSHSGSKLQQWKVVDMHNALGHVLSPQRAPGYVGKIHGYKKIADAFNILRETFRRYVQGPLTGLFSHLSRGKDYPRIFTSEEEEELAEHISKFAQSGFPFTTVKIQGLGFEYAEERGIEGFSAIKKVAGSRDL